MWKPHNYLLNQIVKEAYDVPFHIGVRGINSRQASLSAEDTTLILESRFVPDKSLEVHIADPNSDAYLKDFIRECSHEIDKAGLPSEKLNRIRDYGFGFRLKEDSCPLILKARCSKVQIKDGKAGVKSFNFEMSIDAPNFYESLQSFYDEALLGEIDMYEAFKTTPDHRYIELLRFRDRRANAIGSETENMIAYFDKWS